MSEVSTSNAHEFTVSELAGALKRTVEETYGHVRVRGELGRVTIARSGHVYMDLKDDRAVISSIVWKGVASKFRFAPEEGLEVIAEGRLSTYPGRSQYQLIIEKLEPAGAGALMALLEERRKKFQAEGLFDDAHKQPIPFLPQTIGVITSPTGAVIRDILHRLADRFPRHVLLWPVLVQGDKAAEQVSTAIAGFNALPKDGPVPRPDLLIVARGGGSIEDLWGFNEENVVRAAAGSKIPLISAIGHETDWTLLDYVADRRAPTPTGAAEMAVPVRTELLNSLQNQQMRLSSAVTSLQLRKQTELRAAARGLPRPEDLLGVLSQRFDYVAARLMRGLESGLDARAQRLSGIAGRLRPQGLQTAITRRFEEIDALSRRLQQGNRRLSTQNGDRIVVMAARLARQAPRQALQNHQQNLHTLWQRGHAAMQRALREHGYKVDSAAKLLRSLSHEGVLARGFALVHRQDGSLVRTGAALQAGEAVDLQFSDIRRQARIEDGTDNEPFKPKPGLKPRSPKPVKSKAVKGTPGQGSLF